MTKKRYQENNRLESNKKLKHDNLSFTIKENILDPLLEYIYPVIRKIISHNDLLNNINSQLESNNQNIAAEMVFVASHLDAQLFSRIMYPGSLYSYKFDNKTIGDFNFCKTALSNISQYCKPELLEGAPPMISDSGFINDRSSESISGQYIFNYCRKILSQELRDDEDLKEDISSYIRSSINQYLQENYPDSFINPYWKTVLDYDSTPSTSPVSSKEELASLQKDDSSKSRSASS